jgi:hypothetical protein
VALLGGTSEYEGVVQAAQPGPIRVNLYERVGDGRARLIGTTIVARD